MGKRLPLDQNLGRQFLYVRYDVELSRKSPDDLGLPEVNPELVSKLDSNAHRRGSAASGGK
jgi:hypothetical protein